MLKFDAKAPIVLVGGAGVVGQRLGPLLARLEQRPLLVAGRSAERAKATLKAVESAGGEARFVALDLNAPSGVLAASAVVGLVNDPQDTLLLAALRGSVPFVDITRWTSLMARAVVPVVAMITLALLSWKRFI